MWEFTYSADTDATVDSIWSAYSNVSTWPQWDEDVQHIQLDGSFSEGSTGLLTPKGQNPILFRLTKIRPNQSFTMEAKLPSSELTITFEHTLTPNSDMSTTITHGLTISGRYADKLGPQMGPFLTASIPDSVHKLGEYAQSILK